MYGPGAAFWSLSRNESDGSRDFCFEKPSNWRYDSIIKCGLSLQEDHSIASAQEYFLFFLKETQMQRAPWIVGGMLM